MSTSDLTSHATRNASVLAHPLPVKSSSSPIATAEDYQDAARAYTEAVRSDGRGRSRSCPPAIAQHRDQAARLLEPFLANPSTLQRILAKRQGFLRQPDAWRDERIVATLTTASGEQRSALLNGITEAPGATAQIVGTLMNAVVRHGCGDLPPSLALYAANGHARWPIDLAIKSIDLYHFDWCAAATGITEAPSQAMQFLCLADDTTRTTSPNCMASAMHVLACELYGCELSKGSDRTRQRQDLLLAWSNNGMEMNVAAEVFAKPPGYNLSPDATMGFIERRAIIQHLAPGDRPAAADWIILHAGTEPVQQIDERRGLSDWHAMMAKEADVVYMRNMQAYRRNAVFFAVVAGYVKVGQQPGCAPLSLVQRERLAQVAADLLTGPRPQDVDRDPKRHEATAQALLATLDETHR